MKILRQKSAAAAALLLGGALLASCSTVREPARKTVATATVLDAGGAVLGNALLVRVGDRIDLSLDVTGLPPGLLGTHLHTVGKCEPKSFASAGGHLNPAGRQHGTLSPMGSHLGDLPNLSVRSDGTASLSAQLAGSAKDAAAALFDDDGTAIVIHAGPDDYRTDPTGNSGARIACGVFAKTR